MSKDYYNILGVEKGASDDDIKKAFRKKAHQYHPDKATGDEEKFKEINEAYQVLKDPQKRQQYDQFGSNFNGAGGGPGGFNWADFAQGQGAGGYQVDLNDIFGSFFGGSAGRARQSRGPQRGRDIEIAITIPFQESLNGAKKTITFDKTESCDHCSGNGAEPGTKIETCSTCNGSGEVIQTQQTFMGAIRSRTACRTCMGQGSTFEKPCTTCDGKGIVKKKKDLTIEIPAGINDGETLRLTGEGNAGIKGGYSGDLYVHVRVESSPIFGREGYDIHTIQTIEYPVAVLGGKVDVETVDGSVKLTVPAGTQHGAILKLKGKGVQKLKGRGRGDHMVQIQINIPKHPSKKAKKLLSELSEEL